MRTSKHLQECGRLELFSDVSGVFWLLFHLKNYTPIFNYIYELLLV